MHPAAALAPHAAADPRPASAVSSGTGMAGLAGMALWLGFARWHGLDGPYGALVNLLACGIPMILWSLLIDKVHRNPSTGLDWASPRPWRDSIDISLTRLAGLWITFGGIALIYFTARFYHDGIFVFAIECIAAAAPWLFLASIPYVFFTDRIVTDPRDGTWHLGAWAIGLDEAIDRAAIWNHLRSWGVKAFFLPFMLGVLPGGYSQLIRLDLTQVLADPVALSMALITLMFVIDVGFATVGYMLTLRPLDAHIRTANPYASGWVAALICYPPFILMSPGGPLDYHPGSGEWSDWFAGHPLLLSLIGAVLVALTLIYAWATVAFGLRFSNLTHRGIITNGPYRWTRHPAYLSKNLFWWLSTIPILTTTDSLSDAARNTILLGLVSGVYYWRGKTEERHLAADPAYRDYSAWMERNAPIPRALAWLRGKPAKAEGRP
ncbi:methyltransferase family protein [Sphingomonas sp. 37zxx]|uniref:methyltransferase family protein n=1 Tax=Sphingomonas sp. 37zxx TaxID=1550073 RepID=UPI000AC61BA0|nr:isoprenylcysteine carboxylmethyltransferase family protein [Sphingomonas sp. 37zxx]